MSRIAKLTADRNSVEEYPLTVRDLQNRHPDIGWPGEPTDATLEGTDYVVVVETPMPNPEFGESVIEETPILVANKWTQMWATPSISLAEAKAQLRQMAIEIYWTKMQDVPGTQEMLDAAGSYVTIIQNREARFLPKLNQVRSDIQNASTIAEAYALWLELRDLA